MVSYLFQMEAVYFFSQCVKFVPSIYPVLLIKNINGFAFTYNSSCFSYLQFILIFICIEEIKGGMIHIAEIKNEIKKITRWTFR